MPTNTNNWLDDKIYLEKIDKIDEPKKNIGPLKYIKKWKLSNLTNEKILEFLFKKLNTI